MSKLDYSKIDDEILEALKDGPKTFSHFQYGRVQKEAEALEAEDKKGRTAGFHTPAFRFIDRRVQYLRKAGKITYDTKTGWSLVAAAVAPTEK